MSSEPYLIPFGTLRAHTDAVTAIQVPSNDHYSRLMMIVSTSRDKSLIVWALHPDPTFLTTSPAAAYGQPVRRLTGHNNFVQDVALSSDGLYAISASWDRDLRLWNLSSTAKSTRFSAHTNDVLSVAISPDNRRIISGSRDKTVRVWNTLGECKFTLEGHSDWVSAVRFVPDSAYPTPTPSQTLSAKVVSGSWDSTVKVWDVGRCKLVSTLEGHRGYVNTVAVSPDGSLCASGGRDGVVILWDLGEAKVLYERSVGAIVHALGFCPTKYWLAAASERSVSLWNLETKTLVQELLPGQHESLGRKFEDRQGRENGGLESNNNGSHDDDRKKIVVQLVPTPPPAAVKNNKKSYCTSLAWSNDGDTLFTGYSDGVIRVWTFCPTRF